MTRTFPSGPAWLAWLAERVGTTKWVVASRMTPRLKGKGYEVAISPKRFTALEAEYLASHVDA
jgi:hypothetical protein